MILDRIASGQQSILDYLDLVAGLVGKEGATLFLTSTNWSRLAEELILNSRADMNPRNFKVLKIRNLTVVNSGSEDQEACNEANTLHAEGAHFAWKRDNLRRA
jgi:hypothetical protein